MEKSESTSLGDSTSIDGDAMIKKLKHELRIKTKSEQLAKEKFSKLNKTFDRTTQEFAKYKEEAEALQQNLKHEVQILQGSLQKALQESAEMVERTSAGSGCGQTTSSNPDQVFKIVEEYSKQLEGKGKEVDGLNEKLTEKKLKYDSIKKRNGDLEQKLQRMEHKLAHMSRFSQIFIRSVKQHNIGLKEQCLSSQREFLALFDQTKQTLESQITQQISFREKQNTLLLEKERTTIVELRAKLQDKQEGVSGDHSAEVTRLQAEVEKLHGKNDRLKQKLAAVEVEDTERQLQILKVQHESEREKFEITLEERQKEIANLKQTISQTIAKEQHLTQKLETVNTDHRSEIQRLLERHENSERYKDMREMYESKIETRDADVLQLKQEVIRMQLEGESKEQRHKMFIEEEDNKKKQFQVEEAKKIASMQELTEEEHGKMLKEHQEVLEKQGEELASQHKAAVEDLKKQHDTRHSKLISEREVELEEVFSRKRGDLNREIDRLTQEAIDKAAKYVKELEENKIQFEKQVEVKQRETEEQIIELTKNCEEKVRLAVENEKTEAITKLEQTQEKYESEEKQRKEELEREMKRKEELEGELQVLSEQIELTKVAQSDIAQKHDDEKNALQLQITQLSTTPETTAKVETPLAPLAVSPHLLSLQIEAVPCEELPELRASLSECRESLAEAQANLTKAQENEETACSKLQENDAQMSIESAARQSTEQELWRVQQELVSKSGELQKVRQQLCKLEAASCEGGERDQEGESDQQADTGNQSETENQSQDIDSNMQRKVPPRPVSLAARGRPPIKMNPRPMRPVTHSNAQSRQPDQAVNAQSNQQPRMERAPSPAAPTNPFGATNEQQQKTDTCQDKQTEAVESLPKVEEQQKPPAPQIQAVIQKPETPLIKPDQQQVKKVESPPAPKVEKKQKPEEKKEDTAQQSRFSALLSSLVSTIMPWQKKAPAKANLGGVMKPVYNPATKRWEIPGDDSEESDHAPLPPPGARKKVVEEVKAEEPEQSQSTTVADLGKPVMNPAMRKRMLQKEKEKKEREAKAAGAKVVKVVEVEAKVDVSQNETLYRTAIADTSEIDSRQIQDLQAQLDQANNALIEQERRQNSDKIENQINVERIYKELTEEDEKRNKEIASLRSLLSKREKEQALTQQLHQDFNSLQVDFEQKRMESVNLRKELIKSEGRVQIAALQLDAQQEIIEESQSERSLKEQESIKRQLQDHQRQNETLQWEKSLLQAQQMASQFTESATVHAIQGKLSVAQVRISQLESEMTRVSAAELHKVQEALRMSARDTENYRESTSRLQGERERMAAQLREKAQEHNQQLRRVEQERARQEGEYRKAINDKEQAWQRRINEIQQQKDKEVLQIQAQVREKDSQIAKAQHNRQRERLQAESQFSQLASMMNKSEEQSQELQSMDGIRNKLNEHIIYLQNEVRKRDDMLDGNSDSEIELDNEDDSGDLDIIRQSTSFARRSERSQSVQSKKEDDVDQAGLDRPKRTTMTKLLAGQLEETRASLKDEIESRLTLEKQLEAEQAKLAKLTEGLNDIKSLLPQEFADEEDDDLIAAVTKQFFAQQQKHDSQLMDQQHKLAMLEFEVNDIDTLRFDLDIAASEKTFLENHIQQLKQQVEKNEELNLQTNDDKEKSTQLQKDFADTVEKMEKERAEMEQEWQKQSSSSIALIKTITESNQNNEQKVEDLTNELHSTTSLNDNLQQQVQKQMEAKQHLASEKDQQISELHQSLNQQKSKLALLQGELLEKDEQISFNEQLMEQMQEAVLLKKQETKTKIDNLKAAGRVHITETKEKQVQIDQLEAELTQAKEEAATLTAKCQELKALVETKEMELTAEMAEKESELDFASAANKSALAENQLLLETLKTNVSNLEASLEEKDEELASMKAKELEALEVKDTELAALNADFATWKSEIMAEVAEKKSELELARKEFSSLASDETNEKLAKAESDLAAQSAELEALRTGKESTEAKLSEERRKSQQLTNELLENVAAMGEAGGEIAEQKTQIDQLTADLLAANSNTGDHAAEQQAKIDQLTADLLAANSNTGDHAAEQQAKIDQLTADLQAAASQEAPNEDQQNEIDSLKEEKEAYLAECQQVVTQIKEKEKQKREKIDGKFKQAIEMLQEKDATLAENEAQLTESESMVESLRQELKLLSGDETDKTEAQAALGEWKEKYLKEEQQVLQLQQELSQTHADYQSEANELAAKLKDKNKETKSQLKSLRVEYEELQSGTQTLTQQHMLLQKEKEQLLSEKLQFSESVDLTKIELEREKSNFEVELKLLSDTKDDHKNQVEMAFKAMLNKHNLNPNDQQDFTELLQRCSEVLGNYIEEKRQIQKIVEEKEEAVRRQEELSFQLENVTAHRDLLQNKMERTGQSDIDKQLTKITEEKEEMKNQFMIQFQSFSDEISILSNKLAKYEPFKPQQKVLQDKTRQKESPSEPSPQQTEDQDDGSEYEYESEEDEDEKEKPKENSGMGSYLASFFLTESELKK